MKISEMITEVIDEVGQDSEDTTLTAKFLNYCKASIRRLPSKTRERTVITISSATLIAGNGALTLPSNFIGERQVWYLESGERKEIHKKIADEFNYIKNESTLGVPEFYRIFAKYIEFDVNALSDMTIEIEHFKDVSDGLATTDDFFGNVDLIETIKDLMKFYYFTYKQQYDIAGGFFNNARDQLSDADAEFMEEELGSHVEES